MLLQFKNDIIPWLIMKIPVLSDNDIAKSNIWFCAEYEIDLESWRCDSNPIKNKDFVCNLPHGEEVDWVFMIKKQSFFVTKCVFEKILGILIRNQFALEMFDTYHSIVSLELASLCFIF